MSLSYAQTWALTFNCFLCYGLVWIVLRGGNPGRRGRDGEIFKIIQKNRKNTGWN